MRMQTLSDAQRELVQSLTAQLSAIPRVAAVVLGGSHARGQARPTSDIDLGLFYRDEAPFSIERVRELAREVTGADPVVTDFFEWGPWVNGGAWLTIAGQRVDFLYRSIEHVERVIAEARTGQHSQCYEQQAPFGYYSDTYLAEIETAIVLYDPEQILARLKRSVAEYPPALRSRLVREGIGGAKFDLYATRAAAATGDTYLTAACATRTVNGLVGVLYALNRRYRVNDKTALAELATAEAKPADLAARVQAIFAQLGARPEELRASVERLATLVREVSELGAGALADGGARPAWLEHLEKAGL
jgi:predicted nucleotidyltransferase